MDVFHLTEFEKLKCIHHTIDTRSGFQLASALSYEKNSFYNYTFIRHNGVVGVPIHIKIDNVPDYVSDEMEHFFFTLQYQTHCRDIV